MRKLILLALLSLASCACRAQLHAPTDVIKWDYKTSVDQMTDVRKDVAGISAEYSFDFLKGPCYPYLQIRRSGKDLYILVLVTYGDFEQSDSSFVHVRFDKAPMEVFRYSHGVDGESNIIRLGKGEYFLKRLRKAHTLLIKALIDGKYGVMEFRVEIAQFFR